MKKAVQAIMLLLALSGASWAQPSGQDMMVVMQPDEVLTVSCRYLGRSLASAVMSAQVVRGTDANPIGLVTGQSIDGDRCKFVLAPGAARDGNQYQVSCLATDTTGDKIKCDVLVVVKTVRYRPVRR